MSLNLQTYRKFILPMRVFCVVVLFGWIQASATAQDPDDQDDAPDGPVDIDLSIMDSSRVEGHALCIDCHKVEVHAWMASKHATRAFDLLRTAPTSLKYAEELGIDPADIARNSVCIQCHATPVVDQSGHQSVLGGVSCESCHNPSGGEDGWLNAHAVYGPNGTPRDCESGQHYFQRMATTEASGQLRSDNVYLMAKRCFACHVVSDEKIVDAGHDHGDGFELVAKMMGEVRHNLFLDPTSNAEVATLWTDSMHHGMGRTAEGRLRVTFLVGQLVDLETSLRSLSSATEDNDFSDLMIDRIEEAYELLAEDLLEELEDTEIPEIEEAIEAATDAFEKLDDDGFSPDDAELYRNAADAVGVAAQAFAMGDGNRLQEIDDLELAPEGPFDGVFKP